MHQAYFSAWDTVLAKLMLVEHPTVRAGRYALRSSDGGRTFGDLSRLGRGPR